MSIETSLQQLLETIFYKGPIANLMFTNMNRKNLKYEINPSSKYCHGISLFLCNALE